MTELKHAFDSSGQFAEISLKGDSGAGANAGSRADMVFITTNPLSELVWSPRTGLSIKYANSSLSEKKASLLWNAESFSIMIIPPQCPNGGETSNAQDFAETISNSLQLEENSNSKSSNRIIPPSRPQNAGSYGDMELLKSSDADIDSLNKEKEREVGSCSTSNTGGKCVLKATAEAVDLIPAVLVSDADNLNNPRASKHDPLQVVHGLFRPSEHSRESVTREDGLGDMQDTAENFFFTKHDKHIRSIGRQCILNGDATSSLDRNDIGIAPALQASDENKVQLQKDSLLDKSASTEDLANKNVNIIEDNRQVMYDGRDRNSISKKKVESHESVESSNSKEVISTRKRKWDFKEDSSMENESSKTQIIKKFCPGPLAKQDSSFMNWISAMTSGSSRYNQTKPLALALDSSDGRKAKFGPLPQSKTKNKAIASATTGFQSIFHAIHSPRLRTNEKAHKDFDHQGEAGPSKTPITSKRAIKDAFQSGSDRVDGSLHAAIPGTSKITDFDMEEKISGGSSHGKSYTLIYHDESVKLQNEVQHSSEKLSKGSFLVESVPLNTFNTSLVNYSILGKAKNDSENNCGFNDTKTRRFSSLVAPKSTFVGKATGMLPSVLDGSSNLGVKNRSAFLDSLWITRLSPKAYASMPESASGSQSLEFTNRRRPTEECQQPSLAKRGYACGSIQAVGPSELYGSKRTDSEQKSKLNLNPLLPSQKFVKAEPMASVFGKWFGAFKHIKPAIAPSESTCALATCLFCGMVGHSLRECSELTESGVEDLLKNMNPYDKPDELSCICIRCFEFNHWAASCPYSSSKGKNTHNSKLLTSGSENCNDIKWNGERRNFANNDGGVMLWNGDKEQEDRINGHVMPQNEKSSSGREQTEPVIDVADEPSMLFQMIRQLQLSRTTIIRLMKSPDVGVHLEGFFVRLKVGKWEEGFGCPEYSVARIEGSSSKKRVSVSLGCSQCVVDCRFISNNDFLEDELKAWVAAAMKTDESKLPSREEFREKLMQKMKLGF